MQEESTSKTKEIMEQHKKRLVNWYAMKDSVRKEGAAATSYLTYISLSSHSTPTNNSRSISVSPRPFFERLVVSSSSLSEVV